MKKIFKSSFIVLAVAVIAGYGTYSYFNDTETSTGNTFRAGGIDLKVDSKATYNGDEYATGTWGQDTPEDITSQKFFDFADLKPGDQGTNTISLHVINNDARACVIFDSMANDDNGLTEPESAVDTTGGVGEGELAEELNVFAWNDVNNDNIQATDGTEGPLFAAPYYGPASDVLDGKAYDLGTLTGAQTTYLGLFWCYGTIGGINTGALTCNGSDVTNVSQSDSLVGDIWFYIEQARNNPGFTCPEPNVTPVQLTIGAALGVYVAPTTCDVTVDDDGEDADPDTIQEGVDVATAGQTVCVKAGTYTQDVNINKSLTLVGDGSASTSLTGVGTGYGGALTIAAGIDNVTVEGFTINGTGESALYLTSNNDNIYILYNRIVAASTKGALLTGGQQTNSTFSNNVFDGNANLMAYVNGEASLGAANASSDVDFTKNTFSGTISAGGIVLGTEAANSSIDQNIFNASGSTYGLFETFASATTDVNQNNFNAGGATVIKVRNGDNAAALNAENNWWGDTDPSNNIYQNVDFTPSEAGAFPEN